MNQQIDNEIGGYATRADLDRPAPVTIETINGRQYTVVWHDGKAFKWSGDYRPLHDGSLILSNLFSRTHHIATAIPALPRYPKPEHARLLYRYMAEGIEIGGDYTDMEGKRRSTDNLGNMLEWEYCEAPETRYGLVNECERCDVAIEGGCMSEFEIYREMELDRLHKKHQRLSEKCGQYLAWNVFQFLIIIFLLWEITK